MQEIERLESVIDGLGKTMADATKIICSEGSSNTTQLVDAIETQSDVLERIANALERIADKMEDD